VAVFLKAEENFRTVKGFENIKSVIDRIKKLQTEKVDNKKVCMMEATSRKWFHTFN
jgi:hypothetical protein